MTQPEMARITCIQCNAFYNSERELLDHMYTAHRVGSGRSLHLQAPMEEREEYTHPDEYKETGPTSD
jgi:hypothetical protein